MKETKEQRKRRQENGFYTWDELNIDSNKKNSSASNKQKFFKEPKETPEQIQSRQEEGYYRVNEITNPKKRGCTVI